ncbi:MAG TPA: HsdR family type I site-specific deoxyribonuclease [Dokdonella sp.]|uniref:type I restriction endonuclease subunit R n=1 Tax=Dokdonella sp. TaxID=2291710 RepID=UPI002D806DC2|nr:HsdR family type I site-specific deoxyribonuclease [Dokdonella sp.]HET9034220.1 HsdR family type I site-specific deoxyribonuclease [Dokdonella sp.]
MDDISKPERSTQRRVIALFRDELDYDYLGDWSDRDNNRQIEDGLLTDWLTRRGCTTAQISVVLHKLHTEADNPSRDLYENNLAVYQLLRYGIPVQTQVGQNHETVQLINWANPDANDFAIAEEVTLKGDFERRPDLVLYVNGLAVAVIELKNSRVSIGEGIRQLRSNQLPIFNAWFFSTVQLVIAGNDSEGLQYGTIETPAKFFLKWKEDEADDSRYKLDKYLLKMCRKDRLIELMRDFVLFDGGFKKVPRVHQYFGIKAAQQHTHERKGGIVWHTQGSGKSIVMVLLARWLLQHNPHARVVVITDRDELDKQIERVFRNAGETIYRTHSGRDLMRQLGQASPRLLCSLVHKFGLDARGRKDQEFEAFIEELQAQPSATVGEVFVFVDECHRTQSGRMHKVMKALMPNAVFIGFTGTPLLKKDKQTSLEVFGGYIHTYKFSEAVEDEVVLDLVYEARDIDQKLGSPEKIDQWFEAKTRGLNDWQKDELKKTWGTLQRVLSSRSRMERVVEDMVFDFSVKPRLSSERGNAILVARSILDACKYFTLFQKTPLKGKCAVVTSYNPQAGDVSLEETGANNDTDKQFIYNTYTELLTDVTAQSGKSKTETYEDRAKKLFVEKPATMRLLIVVDKLLTGFDAPPCTYLYIDKAMQDHGLFQAICRTNRLDGDDKNFGYIVDYKDLFKKLVNEKGTGALQVYSSELDHSAEGADPDVLMQDRLDKGRERLDDALEALSLLCEPVPSPKTDRDYIRHFCGNTEIAEDLKKYEPRRVSLYKAAVALLRAYGNLADDLVGAGYDGGDITRIKGDVKRYTDLREVIRRASGETLDLKPYEADMRHLIDTYIEAKEPRKISAFDDLGLLDLIARSGMEDAINQLPDGIKGSKEAVAETIENNVRSKILQEHLNNPAYFEKMSALLDEVIKFRKEQADKYEDYLKKIGDLIGKVRAGHSDDTPEPLKRSAGLRAIYDNLRVQVAPAAASNLQDQAGPLPVPDPRLKLAVDIDEAVKRERHASWRGHAARENHIKREALLPLLGDDVAEVERIFEIIKQQPEY